MQTQAAEVDRLRRVTAERERTNQGTATVERIMRAGGAAAIEYAGRENVQRINAAPLDRLWKDGRISAREFDAGDWLRSLAYLAAIDPGTMAVNWDMAGGGGRSAKVPTMFSTQKIADARIEFRRIERTIRGVVMTTLRLGVIKEREMVEIGRAVFGHGNDRDARVAAAAGLQVALAALADWRETAG